LLSSGKEKLGAGGVILSVRAELKIVDLGLKIEVVEDNLTVVVDQKSATIYRKEEMG
jgi:hypothetical protein